MNLKHNHFLSCKLFSMFKILCFLELFLREVLKKYINPLPATVNFITAWSHQFTFSFVMLTANVSGILDIFKLSFMIFNGHHGYNCLPPKIKLHELSDNQCNDVHIYLI